MRTSRLKLRTQTVNLGDDTGLRWVSLLPEGTINAHGTTWRFDAAETDAENLRFKFEDAVASLERWLTDFAPPIAVEHTKDGTAATDVTGNLVLNSGSTLEVGTSARNGGVDPLSTLTLSGDLASAGSTGLR